MDNLMNRARGFSETVLTALVLDSGLQKSDSCPPMIANGADPNKPPKNRHILSGMGSVG